MLHTSTEGAEENNTIESYRLSETNKYYEWYHASLMQFMQ